LEAVHFYLHVIEEKKHLNAFVNVYAEEAINRAKELDELRASGKAIGRLHGVVIGIKDVICYKDHPVTASSHILQNYVSPYSATAVNRLLQEEAIIIGHLNCDEFAMGSSNENSFYGKVLNPIDESRVPGGSSGGSAAAVKAGLCMSTLGTDTGGSVRQPASFCGIAGFKPGYGTISRHGVIAYASSFDQIGVFALSVKDIARIAEVISGPDEFDSTVEQKKIPSYSENLHSPEGPRRIAYLRQAFDHASLDESMRETYYEFIDQIRQQGHTVEPIEFD